MRYIFFTGFLLIASALPALAFVKDSSIPKAVINEAEFSEKQCKKVTENMSPNNYQDNSELIKEETGKRFGKIYVVNYSKGSCGDISPLCGTGGCKVVVYRLNDGGFKKLYSDTAFGATYLKESDELEIPVHGSRCQGQVGPDPCHIKLNLITGEKRFLGKAKTE